MLQYNSMPCIISYFLEYVQCDMSPTIMFGRLIILKKHAGSTAQLTCTHPLLPAGSSTYICNKTGHWMGVGTCGKPFL